MTMLYLEPEIAAVSAVADALASARVGPRRRVAMRRVGVSVWSDIYLPAHEDYDDGAQPLLDRVRAGTLAGLLEDDTQLPGAWVVAVEPAALPPGGRGGGRPGDEPVAIAVEVTVKALDDGAVGASGGEMLALRHRLADLWRLLRLDAAPIHLEGGEWTVHPWRQAWSGDYRETYLSATLDLTHDGEQLTPTPEPPPE